MPSANVLFVSALHSTSRIWPAPGQPHFCQGHLPREPGGPRRQHPGRGRGSEGEEHGPGLPNAVMSGTTVSKINVPSFIYCIFVLPELTAHSAINVLPKKSNLIGFNASHLVSSGAEPLDLDLFTSRVVANGSLLRLLSDKRHSDRESLPDRCQEADREVKGQAKNGGSAGRQGDPAEHP